MVFVLQPWALWLLSTKILCFRNWGLLKQKNQESQVAGRLWTMCENFNKSLFTLDAVLITVGVVWTLNEWCCLFVNTGILVAQGSHPVRKAFFLRLWGNFCVQIHQGLFCHDQVSSGKFLFFFNLWRNLLMFLDIMEPRTENKNSSLEKNCFDNVGPDMWNKYLNCP